MGTPGLFLHLVVRAAQEVQRLVLTHTPRLPGTAAAREAIQGSQCPAAPGYRVGVQKRCVTPLYSLSERDGRNNP